MISPGFRRSTPGPGYSTAHGPVVEGERIQIGLLRMPRGTGGRPHSHPNEQWVYVLQGTLESEVDGVKSRAPAGSLIYIPANTVHSTLATPDQDVIFLTAGGNVTIHSGPGRPSHVLLPIVPPKG